MCSTNNFTFFESIFHVFVSSESSQSTWRAKDSDILHYEDIVRVFSLVPLHQDKPPLCRFVAQRNKTSWRVWAREVAEELPTGELCVPICWKTVCDPHLHIPHPVPFSSRNLQLNISHSNRVWKHQSKPGGCVNIRCSVAEGVEIRVNAEIGWSTYFFCDRAVMSARLYSFQWE